MFRPIAKTVFLIAALTAGAQIALGQGDPQPKADYSKFESRNARPLEAETLKQTVSLPDLPEFTGHAKFVRGQMHPAERGPNYILRFFAKEDPKLVIDWYKNTLNMYKWKIDYADNEHVTAKKDGNLCAVMVNDITGQKLQSQLGNDKTEIEIDYFQQNNR